MIHHVRMHPGPFAKIADGRKTVEARLRDEKRRTIRIGDSVHIVNREDGAKLSATVIDLVVQPSFEELFKAVGPYSIGHERIEDYKTLYEYYAPDDERTLGVLGIVLDNVKAL